MAVLTRVNGNFEAGEPGCECGGVKCENISVATFSGVGGQHEVVGQTWIRRGLGNNGWVLRKLALRGSTTACQQRLGALLPSNMNVRPSLATRCEREGVALMLVN